MFVIRTEWNVLEDGERVCIFLPDIIRYLGIKNDKVIQKFRQTICEILKKEPKYIVAVIPENIKVSDYYIYEEFYNIELQKIKSLDVFKDDLFNQYLKNDKLYILNSNTKDVFEKLTDDNIDIVLVDNTNINIKDNWIKEIYKGNMRMGKCYMEDMINVSTYLHKTFHKLLPFLGGGTMHQIEEGNDIALIFGKNIKYDKDDIRDKINDLCKHNLLTAILTCNDDIYYLCKDILNENNSEVSIVSLFSDLDIEDISTLLDDVSGLSKEYTSIVFIGEFSFKDDSSKDFWNKEMEVFSNISIFDPHAYASLIRYDLCDEDRELYRMTYDAINMISSYIEIDNKKY